MKKPLSILMAVGLIVYPFAALSEDYGSPTAQQQAPPVAQTLVREGDFAIRLAAQLDLGNPADEASAEDVLTVAGVVPDNGWISDYPMTPEIMGQLHAAIVASAGEGKVPLSAEQASKGLYYLAVQMNLPVPASAVSPQSAASPGQTAEPNPAVVNNYYYDAGPPVVTYYAPPPDYVYLYDWVPYPVWWAGFWFPGFFICRDFTTTIVVTNGPFVTRRAIVSNHIIDPVTRQVAVVTPVSRIEGRVRPVTTLRTPGGTEFRTIHDFRRSPGVREANTRVERGETPRSFRTGNLSPAARNSASSIYSRSFSRSTEMLNRRSGATGEQRQRDMRLNAPERSRGFTSGAGTPGSISRSRDNRDNTYTRPQSRGENRSWNFTRPERGLRGDGQSFSAAGFPLSRSSERSIMPERSGRPLGESRSEGWSSSPGPLQRSFSGPGSGRAANSSPGNRGWWSRR